MIAPVTSHASTRTASRLVVHDWGGAGAPVLLAHPTGFHGRVWAPVAERLVAAGRRVWSFDFRGHGDSDAPDRRDYSWHGFADDVLAVVEHLDLAGDPHLRRVRSLEGRRGACCSAKQKRPGHVPAHLGVRADHLRRPRRRCRRNEDFFLARAARKRRNEWASIDEAYDAYASKPPLDVHDARSRCARTSSTGCATAATACSS